MLYLWQAYSPAPTQPDSRCPVLSTLITSDRKLSGSKMTKETLDIRPLSQVVRLSVLVFLLILSIGLIVFDIGYAAIGPISAGLIFLIWSDYAILRYCRSLEVEKATIANETLELFFQPIGQLIEKPEAVDPFIAMLKSVNSRVKAPWLAIYMIDAQTGILSLLASSDEESARFLPRQLTLKPLGLIEKSNSELVDISSEFDHGTHTALGLRDDDTLYGFLSIGRVISRPGERDFLGTLARHLSDIINHRRYALINRRQDVYQERAAIARELHDSLAQSLTYLKFQSTRLQALIDKNSRSKSTDYSQLDNTNAEMRTNLNIAYSQLRELMTTFRLTMNGKHLAYAIDESIVEFRKRSTIAIDSDIRLSGKELSAQEELHLLQIVREGLSNIVRHSHSTRANISLHMSNDQVLLKVTDNGIGIGTIPDQSQHHGLIIMQERAQRLGGELKVDSLQPQGTCLQISFTPTFSIQHLS